MKCILKTCKIKTSRIYEFVKDLENVQARCHFRYDILALNKIETESSLAEYIRQKKKLCEQE